MRKSFHLLVFVLALALAFATAQTTGSSPSTNNQTTTTPSQPSQSPSTSQSPPVEPSSSQTNPNGSLNQTPSSPEQLPSSQQAPGATAVAGGDIQMQIQNALQKEPTLSNDNITVSVTDDSIDLTGTVASGKEKQTAKRIAQSYAGNRKVKEHLTVKGGGSENKGPDTNPTNPPMSTHPGTMPDQNNTSRPPSGSRPPRS